ncbi:MAG: hypothetical protein U0271_18485 [Polyangiaceae bacterium]
MGDLESKVTRRPRSKLERVLEQLEKHLSSPDPPQGSLSAALTGGVDAARVAEFEQLARKNPAEARRRLLEFSRLEPASVDFLLLTIGADDTVAPSPTAQRVAARLGYPGTDYETLARALDAEVPEGDPGHVAWRAHHLLAAHGELVCGEPPACNRCPIRALCSYHGEGPDPAARLTATSARLHER